MAKGDKITGKFQICLIVKEFMDTGDTIELQPIADYQESCWGWEDTKNSIAFFTNRIEDKLNGDK